MNEVYGFKILLLGLPGPEKIALSKALASSLNAICFDEKSLAEHVIKGFDGSPANQCEFAHRIGWLCDKIAATGKNAIADFRCLTEEAQDALASECVVWIDVAGDAGIGPHETPCAAPKRYDIRVTGDEGADAWATKISQFIERKRLGTSA